jgi:hypothetical protein
LRTPRYSTPDVDFVGGAFTARAVNNLRLESTTEITAVVEIFEAE